MANLGRQPMQIVALDFEACGLTFGQGACAASLSSLTPNKCFNSYATCPVRQAFQRVDKTLLFGLNISGLPSDRHVYPALKSVSTNSNEINLSGVDPRSSPMGKRARVTVVLEDFTYSDRGLDKYANERVSGAAQANGVGYDPQDRSTFFRKLRKRFPYYEGRPLRVYQGYVGDTLEQMTATHYVMSEWRGPDINGRVTITAKDVLDYADNDKAVLPPASRGSMVGDMAASGLPTFTVSPATVGVEYPASGRVCIGQEIMAFTRVGDTFTIRQRAMVGTDIASHSDGDTVQICEVFDGVSYPAALYRICLAAKIPADWLDLAEWEDEAAGWVGDKDLTATIPKPVGAIDLMGEICRLGVMLWPDNEAKKIRFKPNRPLAPGETAYPLTDDGSWIEKSTSVSDDVDERISEVFLWHGVIDPTQDADGAKNRRLGEVALDLASEGPLQYGQARIQQMATRWFGEFGNTPAASAVAERLLSRYQVVPVTLQGVIDWKDAQNIRLNSIVMVTSRLLVDPTGAVVPTLMTVTKKEDTIPGHRAQISVQTFTFDGQYAFWMLPDAPDYDAATELEKDEGAYWIDENQIVFDDGRESYKWF